jgi:CheY-like chemotaxis protein
MHLKLPSTTLYFLTFKCQLWEGIRASKQIRQINSEVPIIPISAAVLPTSLEEAKSNGMNEFIGKPYSAEEILDVIEAFLPKPL